MQNQYDQSQLDKRFNQESEEWEEKYLPLAQDSLRYQDKKYRRQYTLELLGKGTGTVLDLGCGTGSFFHALEDLGYRVIGCDASSNMAELACAQIQKLKNSHVVQGNALQLPFAENTFDALIAVGLLEYLPDDQDFLQKIGRLLKPNARVVITLRNSLCLERKLWKIYRKIGIKKYQPAYYYREHNPRKVTELLAAMGLQKIEQRFCHFYPFPWPLSKFAPPALTAFLANKMENRFSKNSLDFLGSTCIIAYSTPEKKLNCL